MWVDYNPLDVEIDDDNTVLPLLSDPHEISWLNHDSRMTTSGDNASQLMYNSQITAVFHLFSRFTLSISGNSRIMRNPFQTLFKHGLEPLQLNISNPGEVLGSTFAGYVPLASPNPYPIIIYSVANHRPYLSHF